MEESLVGRGNALKQLPPIPAQMGFLAPEVIAYFQELSGIVVAVQQELLDMKVLTVGGADGTLSRYQAMEFLGLKHAKFNLIKEQLTKAGSPGRPRYTLQSCMAWLQQKKPISQVDMARRLDHALLAGNKESQRASLRRPQPHAVFSAQ
ncbi:hypothetical protein FAES_3911 [Fibrella aestuarina BUZ 2]|uniref:Uncharacterized protein n=1 Tax=Fibrella aestuarina BUZ 2 TaxID=1166018 RepID=I0KCR4_9BACT|nr:hypothetical protein [Fibrella aestuarina]CCH01917.1 hypothetical protein FAES_3911 [Fibrella aestuarina BUZ 2]